jgi:hypothetical protein
MSCIRCPFRQLAGLLKNVLGNIARPAIYRYPLPRRKKTDTGQTRRMRG